MATVPKPRHNDRRCCASGEAIPPDVAALRFVRGPDGGAVFDPKGRLPGRGAWVLPRRTLVERAARGGFARSFRAETKIADPGAFADGVGGQLRARALAQLGLARRAGAAVLGFDAVREKEDKLAAYLSPEDASEDGVGKIARRLAAAGGAPHLRLPCPADDLAAALGVVAAVHVGLTRQAPGRAAAEAAALWAGYTD